MSGYCDDRPVGLSALASSQADRTPRPKPFSLLPGLCGCDPEVWSLCWPSPVRGQARYLDHLLYRTQLPLWKWTLKQTGLLER